MEHTQKMEQQLNHLEQQVRGVEVKVSAVGTQVTSTNEKLEKILVFMSGNDLDKDDKGLIGTVNNHETRIEKLEKLRDRGYILFGAMGLTSGIGVWKLIQLILSK